MAEQVGNEKQVIPPIPPETETRPHRNRRLPVHLQAYELSSKEQASSQSVSEIGSPDTDYTAESETVSVASISSPTMTELAERTSDESTEQSESDTDGSDTSSSTDKTVSGTTPQTPISS